MYLKYLALPLTLGMVTASGAQAYDACPTAVNANTRLAATAAIAAPLSTPVITTTTTTFNGAGTPIASHAASSIGTSLAAAAVVGLVGYMWWKHEHNKALAAAAACTAAARPVPADYILKPPADPTAPMIIDGITYSPTAKPVIATRAVAQATLATN